MPITRRINLVAALWIAFAAPAITRAQSPQSPKSPSRSQQQEQIEALHSELKQKEAQFLAVSDQDSAAYADFLAQRDTGICRLMPRETYDGRLMIRGGGAYYSFTERSSEYGNDTQLGLERGQFHSYLPGASYGYITDLGDLPIDNLSSEQGAISDLAALAAASAEPDARIEQRKAREGLGIGNRVYKNHADAVVNHTYVLRAVIYDRSDTLVAFRAVRQDDDGSLMLVWKIFNKFQTPHLIRADPH